MLRMDEIISYGHIENKMMHPHYNPGMEIVLVEQGHLEWAVEKVPEILNPGSVFFTLPWETHGSLQLREPRNRIFYVLFSLPKANASGGRKVRFPAALGFDPVEEQLLGQVFATASRHAWESSPLLRQLMPELVRRLDGSTPLDLVAAASLLRSILAELADIISRTQAAQRWDSPTLLKVKTFLTEVRQSLDHPWNLEEMAEHCGVKRTHLSNIIRQLTGYPPVQYLNRVRFEQACGMLRNTDRPITEIAFDCGYGSSQYFAETFKKQVGMTPSEYRVFVPELDTIMQRNWDYPELRTIVEEKKRAEMLNDKTADKAR